MGIWIPRSDMDDGSEEESEEEVDDDDDGNEDNTGSEDSGLDGEEELDLNAKGSGVGRFGALSINESESDD